jgi:hypothetical protein
VEIHRTGGTTLEILEQSVDSIPKAILKIIGQDVDPIPRLSRLLLIVRTHNQMFNLTQSGQILNANEVGVVGRSQAKRTLGGADQSGGVELSIHLQRPPYFDRWGSVVRERWAASPEASGALSHHEVELHRDRGGAVGGVQVGGRAGMPSVNLKSKKSASLRDWIEQKGLRPRDGPPRRVGLGIEPGD